MDDFDVSQIMDEDESSEIAIKTPGGATLYVLNDDEEEFYKNLANQYQKDNKFTNVSDISELDRLLMMDLMCYRWSSWLVKERDYQGRQVNPADLQKSIEMYSREIRGIKKDLGIDKSTRDKGGAESLADYIENLKMRAKEFGVVRNEQAAKAITILMELRSLITLHENSTDSERREFEARWYDIVNWFNEKAKEFDEIDKDLRANQKYWIKSI